MGSGDSSTHSMNAPSNHDDGCDNTNGSVAQAAEADAKQPLEGGIDAPAAKKAKPADEAADKPELETKKDESEEESGSEEESDSESESDSDEDSDEVHILLHSQLRDLRSAAARMTHYRTSALMV